MVLPTTMDWGPPATLLAAVVGGGFVLWRQVLQWREARRDRVRDAYADWIGAVTLLHRKDEASMEAMMFLHHAREEHEAKGGTVGPGGAVPVSPELERLVYTARREQGAAQIAEGLAFTKIALLDGDSRRILRAQEVKQLVPFIEIADGQAPDRNYFEEMSLKSAVALGVLARDVNRSLELEPLKPWRWDGYERNKEDREVELHARLLLTKHGKRREESPQ